MQFISFIGDPGGGGTSPPPNFTRCMTEEQFEHNDLSKN